MGHGFRVWSLGRCPGVSVVEQPSDGAQMDLMLFPPLPTHTPPLQMGAKFLLECKKGILNFVIMRPICTALGLITDVFDLYGQGQIDFAKSYVYLAAITNFSQVGPACTPGVDCWSCSHVCSFPLARAVDTKKRFPGKAVLPCSSSSWNGEPTTAPCMHDAVGVGFVLPGDDVPQVSR